MYTGPKFQTTGATTTNYTTQQYNCQYQYQLPTTTRQYSTQPVSYNLLLQF